MEAVLRTMAEPRPRLFSSESNTSGTGNSSTTAPPVMSDRAYEATNECVICEKKFHAFRRKHRCRSCGSAVCANCARTHKVMPTSFLVRYSNEPVRVCDRCVRSHAQMGQERRRQEDIERARARQQSALQDERISRMLAQTRQEELSRQRQQEQEERTRQQEELARQRELQQEQLNRQRELQQEQLNRQRELQQEELARQRELQQQELARQRENQRRMQLRALENKHLGPRPERHSIRRRRSMDDSLPSTAVPATNVGPRMAPKDLDVFIGDAETRALAILEMAGLKPMVATHAPTATSVTATATIVPQVEEECAICLDTMECGSAIYTTACCHSFHWRCLKEIQLSDAANADKCPSCRTVMEEMQVKKQCDHPRVRLGHRFCRDCGAAVTEQDAKPRPSEDAPSRPANGTSSGASSSSQQASYRAGSHGALVRCPQCQVQMRVLPHMYNMRVACPSGHMFLVQVAGSQSGASGSVPSFREMRQNREPQRNGGYPGNLSFFEDVRARRDRMLQQQGYRSEL